jgi:glycosyltransferase involved in cell wall biosynthesis
LDLAQGLTHAGIRVMVVFPQKGPAVEWCNKMNISSMVLPHDIMVSMRELKGNRRAAIRNNKIYHRQHVELMHSFNPDVVYVNTGVRYYPLFAAAEAGKKTVLHIREYGELDYQVKHYLFGWWFRKALKQVDRVLFNSKALQSHYCNRFSFLKNKSDVVYNGLTSEKELNAPQHAAHENFNIGIIGALSANKGQYIAIKALQQLRHSRIPAQLHVFGEGAAKRTLQELAASLGLTEHVLFHGFVEDTTTIYSQLDAVAVCSEYEAFGRVAVEAMFHKVPVIGRNTGGTAELLQEFPELMFDGSPEQLANRLMDVYANRKDYAYKVDDLYRFACDTFTREAYVQRFLTVVNSIQ